MQYRKLDSTGDYTFGTGTDWFVNTPATVAQAVLTGLKLSQGSWYLDTNAGMPWSSILGRFTGASYDVLIKEQILNTVGVTEITTYSSSFDSAARSLSVSVSIETVYGSTTLQATL